MVALGQRARQFAFIGQAPDQPRKALHIDIHRSKAGQVADQRTKPTGLGAEQLVEHARQGRGIGLHIAVGMKAQYRHRKGPVHQACQQHTQQQRQWEVAFRVLEFLAHMGKGFDADKTPEHHPQRDRQQMPGTTQFRQQRLIGVGQITGPPDQPHRGNNRQGNRPLHHARGLCRTLAEEQHRPQRGELNQQRFTAADGKQGLEKTGGNIQRCRQTHWQHRKKQQRADTLHPRSKGAANQMRRAASVGKVPTQLSEGKRHWQHQSDQQHPGP